MSYDSARAKRRAKHAGEFAIVITALSAERASGCQTYLAAVLSMAADTMKRARTEGSNQNAEVSEDEEE